MRATNGVIRGLKRGGGGRTRDTAESGGGSAPYIELIRYWKWLDIILCQADTNTHTLTWCHPFIIRHIVSAAAGRFICRYAAALVLFMQHCE